MATRNIEMNYYNGSSYEVLYPSANLNNSIGSIDISSKTSGNLDINNRTTGNLNISSRTTGTLPINRGGTGGTTATSALYNLINGSSILTTLATGDYFPLQDVSGSNAKRITVSNLINYLEGQLDISGGVTLKNGTYYGTGASSGITINTGMKVKAFFLYQYSAQIEGRVLNTYNNYTYIGNIGFISAINPTTVNSTQDVWILTGYNEGMYGVLNIRFISNSITIKYVPTRGTWEEDLAFNKSNQDYGWIGIG